MNYAQPGGLSQAPHTGEVNVENIPDPPTTDLQRVRLLYRLLFRRTPGVTGDTGDTFWATEISEGRQTIRDLAWTFANDPEFTSVHPITTMAPEDVVGLMYTLAYGRVPSTSAPNDELGFWTGWIGSQACGRTCTNWDFVYAVVAGAGTSDEFYNRFY
jgi:hypothetical protein